MGRFPGLEASLRKRTELGGFLLWGTGHVALQETASLRQAVLVSRARRPQGLRRVLAWVGLALLPRILSLELLSFHDLINLPGCVNHELTAWECTFRWLPAAMAVLHQHSTDLHLGVLLFQWEAGTEGSGPAVTDLPPYAPICVWTLPGWDGGAPFPKKSLVPLCASVVTCQLPQLDGASGPAAHQGCPFSC